MPRRAVIAVGIASYPNHAAGNTWAFLQWVLGFRQAGWEIWVVEDVPQGKVIDREGRPCAFSESANLAHWNAVVAEFGLKGCATLFHEGRAGEGETRELLAFARDATFLFNLSGHFRQREVFAAVPERIYVDLDPAFTQIWAEVYRSDLGLDLHDRFFTIGRRLGRPDCRAPLAGRTWEPLGVPVVLDYFTNPRLEEPGATWTTFTHWYGYNPVEYGGAWYGNKSEEFERITELPRHTAEKLEIATDLQPGDATIGRFLAHGWRLREARPLNTPWTRYRDYIAASRGEFCVAKNGYVRSRCGWFSDRSVLYLALGRPVVLQETGWSEFYPAGEGLLAFHDLESARLALETIARDPLRHARAARRLAETHFAAPLVVNRFLETWGRA